MQYVRYLPYFEGLFIRSNDRLKKSTYEYLNPFSCFFNFPSSTESTLLCSLASADASSTQEPLGAFTSILTNGTQPIAGMLRTPNFLPPALCIS